MVFPWFLMAPVLDNELRGLKIKYIKHLMKFAPSAMHLSLYITLTTLVNPIASSVIAYRINVTAFAVINFRVTLLTSLELLMSYMIIKLGLLHIIPWDFTDMLPLVGPIHLLMCMQMLSCCTLRDSFWTNPLAFCSWWDDLHLSLLILNPIGVTVCSRAVYQRWLLEHSGKVV